MTKLCFFINSDWYYDLHWLERSISALKAGYDVHVICHFNDEVIRKKIEKLGIHTHNSNMSEQSLNPLLIFKDLIKSLRVLNEINPDILHCITIKPCLIGGVYSKLWKKKLVLSFVGLGRVFSSSAVFYKFIRGIVSITYKCISKKDDVFFIFEHENDREKIINLTGIVSDKTSVIDGAGINIEEYKLVPEPENETPVVLFASRLIWSKGLGDLIEVKKRLIKRGVFFELQVAGITVKNDPDSISEKTIKDWQSLKLISWLGKSDNVKDLIINANIIALPSVYAEGVPRILIEGAAIGRPCLAYDSGGCESIVKDGSTGYLVDKNNVEELTNKLELLLLNSELRAKFGINGRKRVVENFSSKSVIERTLRIYEVIK